MPKIIYRDKTLACVKCGQHKPVEDFNKKWQKYSGYDSWCKQCKYTQMAVRRLVARAGCDSVFIVRAKLLDSKKAAKVKGHVRCITPLHKVVNLFTTVCKICGIDVGLSIHLDHCHVTGKFRGFLCKSCNTLLANAKDSVELLNRAIEYLKE